MKKGWSEQKKYLKNIRQGVYHPLKKILELSPLKMKKKLTWISRFTNYVVKWKKKKILSGKKLCDSGKSKKFAF